ncbi:conserved hypothetical protein [Theileria equi strain WA]|uniref:Kinetochore protein SPC25 n=1 Tax=Theileria equi strain WA TaxID=1537102 RepID=L1LG57_THEEQ|nr:conserved hypothetical protein [Theileria equi strain WA]EKX74427.1 conserved hypothetical protein [Theileria equi strain WA]|eukprot:XP_004833879.1 conserved hypothetical protein [Theileria equi strain WA]
MVNCGLTPVGGIDITEDQSQSCSYPDILRGKVPTSASLLPDGSAKDRIDLLENIKLASIECQSVYDRENELTSEFESTIANILDKKALLQSHIQDVRDSLNSVRHQIQANDIAHSEINDDTNFATEIEATKQRLGELRNEKAKLKVQVEKKAKGKWSLVGITFAELEDFRNTISKNEWFFKFYHFEKVLGLGINSENGALKITFSNLGQQNPDKMCYIVLKVFEDQYSGLYCEPQLSEFDAIVSELNSGLDIGLFLCRVRQLFKISCNILNET